MGFPAPCSHLPLGDGIVGVGTDIVGPRRYALTEAHVHIIGRRTGVPAVQLLIDCRHDDVEVVSRYSGDALTVGVQTTEPIRIRILHGVSADRMELIGAHRESGDFVNGYLHIARAESCRFPVRMLLAEQELDVACGGRMLRALARGDRIVAMENRGTGMCRSLRIA